MELNKIIHGDCIETMKTFPDNSIDSVVTDSPYGLAFMGKHWDTLTAKGLYDFVLQWSSEVFRVLKPGGYLLSFGGTRTYHRMTCAIEDAGFEIRDCILAWLYGSGFPKSLNIGKAIMKIKGDEGLVTGTEVIDVGMQSGSMHAGRKSVREVREVREATNPDAIKWEGWGTALKPACEPIVVARKPISEKTVAENVLKWGTGGINIDGCRIPLNNEQQPTGSGHLMYKNNAFNPRVTNRRKRQANSDWDKSGFKAENDKGGETNPKGRFPANIILDEEAARLLDEQTGTLQSGMMKKGTKRLMSDNPNKNAYAHWNPDEVENDTYGDSGGASRFFYCAKSSRSERNRGCEILDDKQRGKDSLSAGIDRRNGTSPSEKAYIENPIKNHHPTVKPISLMQYLVKLVTQKGGVCLDPFGGSGSTGIACKLEGVNYILIEKESEYVDIATARVKSVTTELKLF